MAMSEFVLFEIIRSKYLSCDITNIIKNNVFLKIKVYHIFCLTFFDKNFRENIYTLILFLNSANINIYIINLNLNKSFMVYFKDEDSGDNEI